MLCVITTIRLLLSVDGSNKGQKLKQVHKVNGPHEGSRLQSTKWTDPTKGQYTSPKCGRTPQRVKTLVHKVDGHHGSKKLTRVHNVDGLHKGSGSKSIKWTDTTKGQNSSP